MNLSAIFGKFAGREVNMVETVREIKIGGHTHKLDQAAPASDDKTIEEMRMKAENAGLILRLWWPGMMGTMDVRADRVNAYVEKAADGKWRIGNDFRIG